MKKTILVILSVFALTLTASAQSMKVYQNGQLKAIYYVSKDDKIEFSDDFPFPEESDKEEPTSKIPVGKAVDLGLSVKWADMNIGAEKTEDYGWYLAWGESKPKDVYNWSTYFDTNDGGNTFSKYTTSTKTTLDPEDDAAHVNWGGDWRMPTTAKLYELRNRNNCTWVWTTQNGVKGYKVTSKVNGNSIFLPAAGSRWDGELGNAGSDGGYWSSSHYGFSSNNAYSLGFDSGYVGSYVSIRDLGKSVRPVCP